MKVIIGYIMVTAMVLGGYLMAHGVLIALWQPAELVIIFGGALGAFIVGNPPKILKVTPKEVVKAFKGSPYNKAIYLDLLGLMYELFSKSRKEGLMALEADIEEPSESEIFNKYPKISADHHVIEFICDYIRLMVGGTMNPFELENLMDVELETHHHEAHMPSAAMANLADSLPAFGIVAAVMGVVITMGSLGGPVEEIGAHVAAALVGTFLGILLGYGFFGPLAQAMGDVCEDEGKFYQCIKVCILATLNGYNPQVAIEFGRKSLLPSVRPGFLELEEFVKGSK